MSIVYHYEFFMIRNFVISNFVRWEFCALGILLLRNFVTNFAIRIFVFAPISCVRGFFKEILPKQRKVKIGDS